MGVTAIREKAKVGIFFALLVCFASLNSAEKEEEKSAPPEAEASYVGSDACSACHEDFAKAFARTKMGKIFAMPRTDQEKKGCEACHGPASSHLDDPTTGVLRYAKADAKTINSSCLSCHNANKATRTWEKGMHSKSGLSCVSCHKILADVPNLLMKPEQDVCISCHKTVQASFRMPSRHPMKEGKVRCSDCHNPHDPRIKPMATSLQQSCVSCHQEKRGPFRFPHRPVSQNCLSCHLSHGSPNPDILTLRQPSLCLQCHPILPATHSLADPKKRQCTSCHSDIHGSNKNPRYFP